MSPELVDVMYSNMPGVPVESPVRSELGPSVLFVSVCVSVTPAIVPLAGSKEFRI